MRVPQVTERIKEAPVQALRGVLAGIGQVLLFTDKLRNKNAAAQADDAEGGTATATAVADPPEAPPAEASVATEASVSAEGSVAAEDGTAAEAPVTAEAAVAAEAVPAAEAAPAADAAPPADAASTADAAPAAEAAPAKAARSRASSAKASPAKAGPAKTGPAKTGPAKTRTPSKPRDLDKTGNVRVLPEDEAGSEDAAPVAEEPVAEEPVAEAPKAEAPKAETPKGEAAGTATELPLPSYDDLTVASIRARLRNLTAAQVATLADYEKTHEARPEVITMFERRIAKLEAEG
jgi:hypothetical protein